MSKEHKDESLFDVVFDGRPLPGISPEKASSGLAGLLRKQPEDIAHLFNERPTVLKRKVSEKTALQYCQALQDVGLACHIAKTGSPLGAGKGKKASSPQTSNDVGDESTFQVDSATRPQAEKKRSRRFRFPERGRLIRMATLSFLLPENLELDASPADLPPAAMGRKMWSAVSTFFHGLFLGYLLAFPAGLAAGLFLRFSGADVTKSTLEAIRGGSLLLGMATAVFLIPLLWRGHSFGQRALGIMVVPATGEDADSLDSAAIMIRRLTFQTRSVCAGPLPHRPWNKALFPFAAVVLFHLALIPFSMAVMGVGGSSDLAYLQREIARNRTTNSERTLRDVKVAIFSYIGVNFIRGSEPLTPDLFEKAMKKYLPWHITRGLMKKLNNGTLKLDGVVAEFRIGIYEDGHWTILDASGKIYRANAF